LCVNARDAMPDGGRIVIQSENILLTETEAKQFPGASPGVFVKLSVADTGSGIPQAIIDRIFEPFFTTKEVGKGTGLGLSTVANIVKNHAGFLDVTSVIGQGTTFTMLFPASESAVPAQTAEVKPLPAAGIGRLVLVVDDEPMIRSLLHDVLTGNGYRILVAENGALGLTLFQQHMAEISLVMIDMMMPVLDGYKAIAAMQQLRPETHFVAMSGMLQPANLPQTAAAPKIELLNKPFTVQQVFETLTRVK
jgi:CheY-like chemotaxis protein